MPTKTHWKKIQNPDYIGAYSLMEDETPKDLVVRFKSVSAKPVKGEDGKDETCIVAEIYGNKPMIINATNAKTLTKLFGSPMIEDWVNKPLTLFVAKVRAFGDTVDALRIRPTAPKLPELAPGHEKWDGALKALKAGKTTIDAIRANYSLTLDNEALLTSPDKP